MTTMIALVGDQPQPNFLPALHYKPDIVMLAYTSQKKDKYEYLRAALEVHGFTVFGVEVHAYDMLAVISVLNKEIDDKITPALMPLIVNLTGGTKTMSLAAYQIAVQRNASVLYLQSESGSTIVDHYNWQNNQLHHQSQEQLPAYLRLCDVLDLHLGQGKDERGKKRWEEKGTKEKKDNSHLFELAIADTLRSHGYEVMVGVQNSNNNVDIDVLIGYRNQIGIIEAKSSENGQGNKGLDGVKQLNTAMRYVGGIYIRPFLILDGKPSDDQKIICELLRIKIISLPHYRRGPDAVSLSPEDVETLLSDVDKVLNVQR